MKRTGDTEDDDVRDGMNREGRKILEVIRERLGVGSVDDVPVTTIIEPPVIGGLLHVPVGHGKVISLNIIPPFIRCAYGPVETIDLGQDGSLDLIVDVVKECIAWHAAYEGDIDDAECPVCPLRSGFYARGEAPKEGGLRSGVTVVSRCKDSGDRIYKPLLRVLGGFWEQHKNLCMDCGTESPSLRQGDELTRWYSDHPCAQTKATAPAVKGEDSFKTILRDMRNPNVAHVRVIAEFILFRRVAVGEGSMSDGELIHALYDYYPGVPFNRIQQIVNEALENISTVAALVGDSCDCPVPSGEEGNE